MQMPRTVRGNRYVIVFMDYLTKWVEAFAIPDQTALTVVRTLVEKVIPIHGVPKELLSDRGTNFLSNLATAIYQLIGTKKINT